MKRLLIAVLAVTALALPATAWASYWKNVSAKTVTGFHASASISGTIATPHGIRIRTNDTFTADVFWTLLCRKDTNSVGTRGSYTAPAGFVPHRLTMPFNHHPDTCLVTVHAALRGSGTLRVAIQKLIIS
jgi:hypothetical protein